jgi:hypothetical protein
MLFFGIDRYRLPFMPWMIIESSIVVAWLGNLLANKQRLLLQKVSVPSG